MNIATLIILGIYILLGGGSTIYIGRIPVCRPGTENHSENKIWSFLVLLTKFSSTL